MVSVQSIILEIGEHGMFTYLCIITIFFLLLDSLYRRYTKRNPELGRWVTNFLLYVSNSLIAFGLLILLGFQVDQYAANINFGLFKLLPSTNLLIEFIVYSIVLDFLSYWLHRAQHHWVFLWRLHLVHHSDTDLDFSVSFRFHPFERVLDIPLVMTAAFLTGADLVVLLAYNIVYSFFAFFPHANLKVPEKADHVLRLLICTPDMHRVHHSSKREETNSNYGDVFSFWDRMFGTYKYIPLQEQYDMKLGLEYFRSNKDKGIIKALLQPFLYNGEIVKEARKSKLEYTKKHSQATAP